MLYEISGACQHCATEYTVTVHNDKQLNSCPECGESPFGLKKYKGLVYIVKNENQAGVKIGMTERTIESRLKSLNNTSVPGKFKCVALFPSDRPKKDETKIHDKLVKFKLDKEHFDLSPVDACLKCYRTLNRKRPIFHMSDVEEVFDLKLQEAKIQMEIRLKGKSIN
ncbi:GIY-YIG nuclease family protein [Pontiellaceae bacterium B12219]|nr:GIY-YIG nuclease family protein [Pontiellaceae bacterium B12219]